MRFLHVSELLPTPAGQFQESLGRYYRVGRGCDNGSGLTGRARRASEGSRAFPSLARRVSMQKHAELPCRGNISRGLGPVRAIYENGPWPLVRDKTAREPGPSGVGSLRALIQKPPSGLPSSQRYRIPP